TPAKKWVYAQADADVPWLRVTTPAVSGSKEATVAFEVDPSQITESRVLEGHVQLRANAGTRLAVRVYADARRLDTRGRAAPPPRRPRRPAAPAGAGPAPAGARRRGPRG